MNEAKTADPKTDPMMALEQALNRIAVLERQVKQLQGHADAALRLKSGSHSVAHAWAK